MEKYRIGVITDEGIVWGTTNLPLSDARNLAVEMSEIYQKSGFGWCPIVEKIEARQANDFFVLIMDKETGEVDGRWIHDVTPERSIVDYYIEAQPNEVYFAVYDNQVSESEAWSDFASYTRFRMQAGG